MTVALTLFDAQGKNPHDSTIEYAQAPGNDRTAYTENGVTSVHLASPSGDFFSEPWTEMPYYARRILDDLLDPGPSTSAIERSQPEVRPVTFGAPLDCIMLGQPLHYNGMHDNVPQVPLGLFPTYCVQPHTANLRITTESGSLQVLRDQTGQFLGRIVPIQARIVDSGMTVVRAKVTMMASFAPDASTFATTGLQLKKYGITQISSGVMQGMVLSKTQPIYPDSARARRASGSVVLRAIIGTDGRVRQLTPMSLPDADLAVAALTAVRQWRYKPYLLDGVPTEVDTSIIVNFNLNPG